MTTNSTSDAPEGLACAMCANRFPHNLHVYCGPNAAFMDAEGKQPFPRGPSCCPLCGELVTFTDAEFNNAFCFPCSWMGAAEPPDQRVHQQSDGELAVAHMCAGVHRFRAYPALLCSSCTTSSEGNITLRQLVSELNTRAHAPVVDDERLREIQRWSKLQNRSVQLAIDYLLALLDKKEDS